MADNGSDSTPSTDPNAAARRFQKKRRDAFKAAGSALSSSGQDEMERASSDRITPVSYKRGGKTRKTGIANLHKGERIIPKGKVKRVEKMMRKAKMRMKARG